MSNQWLRLWHDMPNDPKWRTIARISGQPISVVLAVYLHLMVDASRNVTRGHVDVTVEDIASALDVTDEQVEKIYGAMQGRVMDGNKLTGWEKRQPKREDSGDSESGAKSAAERKREQRGREKEAHTEKEKQACHAVSRNVTLDTDTDTDTENIKTLLSESGDSNVSPSETKSDSNVVKIDSAKPAIPYQQIVDAYHEALPELPSVRVHTDARRKAVKARWLQMINSDRGDGTLRYTDAESGIRWWAQFFSHVRHNSHWMGDNDRAWTADFDWLLTAANFVKVLEYRPRASA